jgi:hypothetical protein
MPAVIAFAAGDVMEDHYPIANFKSFNSGANRSYYA